MLAGLHEILRQITLVGKGSWLRISPSNVYNRELLSLKATRTTPTRTLQNN